jgi:hypothetical protein
MAGMGNPDGSLHDATTFGEGHLTKHVPSFGVVEPETLCPTNMRATVPIIGRSSLRKMISPSKQIWFVFTLKYSIHVLFFITSCI